MTEDVKPLKVELRVLNDPAYVWRVNSSFSYAEFGWIPCWYAVDQDGNTIEGGYISGGNTKSGHADYDRKKDIVAFVRGFHWAQANLEKIVRLSPYLIKGSEPYNPYTKDRATFFEKQQESSYFEKGVERAFLQFVEGENFRFGRKVDLSSRIYAVKPVLLKSAAKVA